MATPTTDEKAGWSPNDINVQNEGNTPPVGPTDDTPNQTPERPTNIKTPGKQLNIKNDDSNNINNTMNTKGEVLKDIKYTPNGAISVEIGNPNNDKLIGEINNETIGENWETKGNVNVLQ